jgi:hypothetical protein
VHRSWYNRSNPNKSALFRRVCDQAKCELDWVRQVALGVRHFESVLAAFNDERSGHAVPLSPFSRTQRIWLTRRESVSSDCG